VEVNGVISFPPRAEAEGLFDYRSYLRRQGVYYQVKIESTKDWTLVMPSKGRPVADRFLAWAQGILAKGLGREDESLELLWAMTLGWKTALTNEIYEPFMRSGTMHIFAISGLHIALISGILVAVLRVMRIARAWCGVIVVPLIWFYTGVTGWQPSAIRSAIMMTIIIGGWSLKRPSDLLNSLAASAFIILLWDPQQLFGASFQLSFFCVLSIALVLPPVQRWFDRLVAKDPLLPAELVPAWRQKLDGPLRWLVSSLATSTAAWLGSLPLTAYYFHLFSPVTLLANLLIVPLSSMALACNVGSLICGYWLPWVTELFNHSAWLWMECMIRLSEWASIVPGFYLYVRGPSDFDMALYYAALAGALSGWLIAPERRTWALVGAGIVAIFYFCGWEMEHHSARVSILAENGGLTVFAESPGLANELLIDPGTTNTVERVLKPYLRARGLNRLASMVLTHGDVRHVSGSTLLADLFSLRRVYTSPVRFRSPAYRRALSRFDMPNNRAKIVRPADVVESWTVLYPSEQDHFPQADNNALVLTAKLYGTRILLVSDLGIKGQNALLARGPDLKADIVVTGLPTDGEALSDAFLEAVQPRAIIVGDSEYPASEQARPRLRSRLEKRKVPVFYSRAAGTITIEFRRGKWRLQTANGIRLESSNTSDLLNVKE
jgi:competence protein ComEC